MNIPARLHNNPPNPIDEALAPYGDFISEAESWADGSPVENADQMKAVDGLTKEIKAAKKAVSMAEESEAKPIYDQWKAKKAEFKPTLDDLDRIIKALVGIVAPFKAKLAAEKKAAERAAWEAADKLRREAEAKAALAAAGDLEARREADAAKQEALEAQKAAQVSARDKVGGMRKVVRFEIHDHRAALHDIAKNDRPAITEFIDAYVAKNFKLRTIDGVKVTETKEAF